MRIRLVPFAAEDLLTILESPDALEARFGHPMASGLDSFFRSDDVSPAWLDSLRRASGADPWRFGFAVVLPERGVIGTAGYKGPPDREGVVEIAYGIVPAMEGQGYATEAAAALVAFALQDPRVREVRAHTLPEVNASGRVLEKCGFRFAGAVEDPEDGPVWRWRLDPEAARAGERLQSGIEG